MGHYNHSILVDTKIMVSKNCPIIDEQVTVNFVARERFQIIFSMRKLRLFAVVLASLRTFAKFVAHVHPLTIALSMLAKAFHT